jgi:SSS family solute:Na+ symporter
MIIIVVAYLCVIGFLGFRGYQTTKSATDYMIGGRKVHPYIMAMSYGATFISTSAIVGFGGAAGVFGMGLLWLTFMNIFIGIFIAFWVFGGRTRRMGLRLDAHTFPELLGRRFQSKFIQGAAAVIIFMFIPLYASAVLIGAVKYISTQLAMDYNTALFVFAVIIAMYVIMGGIKGVMYTDALQGTIMLLGMTALLILTYVKLGGVTAAHQSLTDMANMVPEKLAKGGHMGWTSMPKFGAPLWWVLVSTIIMGVGIGVLAQPQLAVRYMTVKSGKELNRAIPIGGVFIMMMTGVAFIVGALSNVHFNETLGKVSIVAAKGSVEEIIPMYLQSAMPEWFSILFMLTLISAAMSTLSSQFHVMGTSLGRDLVEESLGKKKGGSGMLATRFGIFFGLCACAFLPMYVGALWSRGITKAGAIAGLLSGSLSSLFWLFFIQEKTSTAMLLCGKLSAPARWQFQWLRAKKCLPKPDLLCGLLWIRS